MNAYSNTVSDWSKYLGSASGFLELFAHNLAKRIHNMSVSDTGLSGESVVSDRAGCVSCCPDGVC